jgi:hypothetical protein
MRGEDALCLNATVPSRTAMRSPALVTSAIVLLFPSISFQLYTKEQCSVRFTSEKHADQVSYLYTTSLDAASLACSPPASKSSRMKGGCSGIILTWVTPRWYASTGAFAVKSCGI